LFVDMIQQPGSLVYVGGAEIENKHYHGNRLPGTGEIFVHEVERSRLAKTSWKPYVSIRVPVLDPKAAAMTGMRAINCVHAAWRALARGWGF